MISVCIFSYIVNALDEVKFAPDCDVYVFDAVGQSIVWLSICSDSR